MSRCQRTSTDKPTPHVGDLDTFPDFDQRTDRRGQPSCYPESGGRGCLGQQEEMHESLVHLPTDSKQNHESRMETLLHRRLSRAKNKLSGKHRIWVVRESQDLEKGGASTLR